jgi:hypothetical protein
MRYNALITMSIVAMPPFEYVDTPPFRQDSKHFGQSRKCKQLNRKNKKKRSNHQ